MGGLRLTAPKGRVHLHGPLGAEAEDLVPKGRARNVMEGLRGHGVREQQACNAGWDLAHPDGIGRRPVGPDDHLGRLGERGEEAAVVACVTDGIQLALFIKVNVRK